MPVNQRILNEKVAIDGAAVARFFEKRAAQFDTAHPLVSILYQDSNPALAEARDIHEKRVTLPYLQLRKNDRVLDIGCGIGRWADAMRGQVARYHGTDLVQGLTDIATRRLADAPGFTFQALPAQDNRPDRLACPPPFDLIIIAGVFAYLNDDDCRQTLRNAADSAAKVARMLLREPVGLQARLTLQKIWSDELQHEYSAIYRTVPELLDLITAELAGAGFKVTHHAPMLTGELSNRKETSQHFFIIQRP